MVAQHEEWIHHLPDALKLLEEEIREAPEYHDTSGKYNSQGHRCQLLFLI